MHYLLSHNSALQFWRRVQAKEALAKKRLRLKKAPVQLPDSRAFLEKRSAQLTLPIHVLVGSRNARKATKNLHCHVCSEELPGGSFIEVGRGLLVSSPELCFLQMASEYSLTALVKLGYEFCGGYRLGNNEDVTRGFRDDLPLTNVAKLNSYIQRAPAIKGKKKACRALQFIAEGSASPMETKLTILLTLPYRLGGYGLPMPLLNHFLAIQGSPTGRSKKRAYRCDLFWSKQKVAVEYDSEAYHAHTVQMTKDALRRNDLIAAGITVVVATKMQVMEAPSLRELAELLGKLLNKRMKYLSKEFPARHAELRSSILSE